MSGTYTVSEFLTEATRRGHWPTDLRLFLEGLPPLFRTDGLSGPTYDHLAGDARAAGIRHDAYYCNVLWGQPPASAYFVRLAENHILTSQAAHRWLERDRKRADDQFRVDQVPLLFEVGNDLIAWWRWVAVRLFGARSYWTCEPDTQRRCRHGLLYTSVSQWGRD